MGAIPNVADIVGGPGYGWASIIQQGSYDGVNFDFVSTRDQIGRVVDRQVIPGRDGQRLQDRQGAPIVFDVLAIFVEDDYPDTMNQLIAKIIAGGVREFVHPIFGSFKAMVTQAGIEHNAEDSIDSATMQLHVEEHTETTQGPVATKTSTAALANAARTAALNVLNSISVYAGAADAIAGTSAAVLSDIATTITNATSAANLASATADNFDANGDEMSAIEVQAAANAVLSASDSLVTSLGSCETNGQPLAEQYDLVQSIVAMAASTSALATATAAGKPQLTTFQVDADISLLLWAHQQYGDSTRADEVLALNPGIADPLNIVAGTELTAYAA